MMPEDMFSAEERVNELKNQVDALEEKLNELENTSHKSAKEWMFEIGILKEKIKKLIERYKKEEFYDRRILVKDLEELVKD